jgi:thioredoxin reductase (NADPH)
VAVVGGGNSAGQAVVRVLAVRVSRDSCSSEDRGFGDSMSQYLVKRVSSLENVEIRTGAEVIELEADTRLRTVVVSSPADGRLLDCRWTRSSSASAASRGPREPPDSGWRWTRPVTSGLVPMWPPSPAPRVAWALSRPPLPLETNQPGLFAAGDVRSGSIKRCSAAIGEGSMAVALVHRASPKSGRLT